MLSTPCYHREKCSERVLKGCSWVAEGDWLDLSFEHLSNQWKHVSCSNRPDNLVQISHHRRARSRLILVSPPSHTLLHSHDDCPEFLIPTQFPHHLNHKERCPLRTSRARVQKAVERQCSAS